MSAASDDSARLDAVSSVPPPKVPAPLVPYAHREDERLLSRRPWYIAGIVLVLFSLVVQQPLLIAAGLLVLALGVVPEVWYRFCLSGVTVSRSLGAHRAEVGDEIGLTLTVENGKLLPLPRLEVDDEVPDNVRIHGVELQPFSKARRAFFSHILSPWAFQRVTRRYHLRCADRGVYDFGPVHVRSGDPFGLLTREAEVADREQLIVYPLVVPIERLIAEARVPLGERASLRRMLEDPLRLVGVREYAPGDDPRHVHWKATARTGVLQTKQFEPSTRHTIALFLDVRTSDKVTQGYSEDLVELAICTAASVATWATEHDYAVGLFANGSLTELAASGILGEAYLDQGARLTQIRLRSLPRVAPSNHGQQLARIYETLARLNAFFAGSILDVLAREESQLPFGATVVYVGAAQALGSEGVAALHRLRAHGHPVSLLLTGDTPMETGRLNGIVVGNGATWQRLRAEALTALGMDPSGKAPAPDAVRAAPTVSASGSATRRPL